MDEKSK